MRLSNNKYLNFEVPQKLMGDKKCYLQSKKPPQTVTFLLNEF